MNHCRSYLSEAFPAAGAVLPGRLTYQIFAAYWPTVTNEEDEIARALNCLPKYAVSPTWTRSNGTERQ